MCGEIEEDERIDEELFSRFLSLSRRHGVSQAVPGDDAPTQLANEHARKAYMEKLFQAALARAANDAGNLPAGERMDALAGQAIVFARLAGFLAGQFPPEADLFRTIMAAAMEGHSEPRRASYEHHHHHDHSHA
jgi:hypothetical protein